MTEIYCMLCDAKLKHKDYEDDKVRVHPCETCRSSEKVRRDCGILGEFCDDCDEDCSLNF